MGEVSSRRLEGRVALVTGASSGIGEAIAIRFCREGAKVHLSGTNEARLEAVAARTQDPATDLVGHDLADTGRVGSLVTDATSRHGRLDIVVNCGAMVDRALRVPADETPIEVWDRVLAVNLTAPFLLSVAALKAFRSNGGGSIINVASIGGIGAFPRFCAYVVSKAALIGLTKSMALDYGRQGVRVNAIAPGAIDTPQVSDEPDRPGYLQMIAASTALDRIGQPEEVASVAVFLASDEFGLCHRRGTGRRWREDGQGLSLARWRVDPHRVARGFC